jgi:Na+/pantothenate symporter
MLLFAQGDNSGSNSALIAFVIYILGVFGLAVLSNRLLQKKSFMSEYFLGSRSLGVWAFALTFAATSASGGSFTGFPSKVYTHGWILALWIGSYMVVPICTMGLLGKRLNQVARKTGAITIPDVLRDRFNNATFGLLAIVLIVFFMSFNLVAQFKAGSLILQTLLMDVPLFQVSSANLASATQGIAFLEGVDGGYLLCLVTFATAVIIYTTYGGFRAVVWTDVMQGIVMVIGVMILLPLALMKVGGLKSATEQMARMTPPRFHQAHLEIASAQAEPYEVPNGTWMKLPGEDPEMPRVFRTAQRVAITAGDTSTQEMPEYERTVPADQEQTDEGVRILEITTPEEIARILEGTTFDELVTPVIVQPRPYGYGDGETGVYTSGPGPDPNPKHDTGFLALSLAISFFVMWAISGSGQPSNMVRLMAFNSAMTLRRAIFTVTIYYSLIYLPLVFIFCCARIFMPGMEAESDRIMPATAVFLTTAAGWPWLAGLLVAAPFAAVMSTVDSFLLMISSALVRDIYQRNMNPEATEKTVKRLSYFFTFVVGTGAMLGAVNPPEFLQDIIVYTGSGLAACFLAPMALSLYWPRVNVQGATVGMLGGFLAHLGLYVAGFAMGQGFSPYRVLSMDPIIWGLGISFLGVIVVSLLTAPPPEELVRRYFYKEK